MKQNDQEVIVVGGGIVGCMTAFFLAKNHVNVTMDLEETINIAYKELKQGF